MDLFEELGFKAATPKSFAESGNDPFASLGFKETAPAKPKAFRYEVEPVQQDQKAKIAQAQAEAETLRVASEKDNSLLGMTKNFGKAFVENIAPSEVGLGKTISKIASDPNALLEQHQSLINSNMTLRKTIAKRQAAGQDVTALMRGYNSTQDLIDELSGQIQDYSKELPTTKAVLGQLGGTALDVLTAGTYGKAAGAMKSGSLAPRASTLPTIISEVKNIAKKPSKILSKEGLGKVAEGGAIGYGYDVTQGLQNGEESPYMPGFGTLLGAGIPIASRGVQATKNLGNKSKAIDELEQTYTDLMSGTTPGKKKVDKLNTKTEMLNRAGTEGRTPQRTLAEGGVIPKHSGTKLDTYEQAADYRETVKPLRDANREALKEVGLATQPVPLNTLEEIAVSNVRSQKNIDAGLADGLEKQVRGEFEKLRKAYGEAIPLSKMDDIKSARWDEVFKNKSLIDADRLRKDSDYAIAKAMQKNIEDVAAEAGHIEVAQLNREIGDRLEAAKFLEDLNGKTLKGGRVLKYVTTLIGSGLGDTILGKVAGALGGNIVGSLIINASVASPIKRLVLRNLKAKDPAAFIKTVEWLRKQNLDQETRLLLPAPGESLVPKGQKGSAIPSVIAPPAPTTFEAPAQRINMTQSKSPTAQQTNPAMTTESKNPMGKIVAPKKSDASKAIPKELEPLAKEARKYKSAEEFYKSLFAENKNEDFASELKIFTEQNKDLIQKMVDKDPIRSKENVSRKLLADFYDKATKKNLKNEGKISLGAVLGTAGVSAGAVALSTPSKMTYVAEKKPQEEPKKAPKSDIASVNNNPGNLIFKGQVGAKQGEKRPDGTYWAVFDTPEAGYKAMGRDIEIKLERKPEMTLRELIEVRSPSSDGNDLQTILYNISDELFDIKDEGGKIFNGKSLVKNIPMDRLLKAIAKSEGYKD